jgi:hypothetical protein
MSMHVVAPAPKRRGRPTRLAVALAAAGVFVIGAVPAARADPPAGAADPAVVNTWNAIAMTTITGPAPTGAGKANAEAFLWLGYVHAAVYNAVNGITREFELYESNATGPKGASPQAAAAAAAHGVLMEYFGTDDVANSAAIAANLDAQLAASLAPIPDGVSEDQGVRYGEQAAEHLIELREDDGRFAPIVFAPPNPTAPGVWRPTPPAMAPFFAPWLGFVEPLLLDSASQFRPGPPPAINSPLYVEEFEEVRDYGVNVGSLRDAAQTESALFFSDTGIGPLHAAIRDLAVRRGDDISERARLFGAVQMIMADALFAIWDAKYHYGWWRPITAIREADTDGNDATSAVPGWTPLVTTPPYPDWPSGLCGIVGAASTALMVLYGSVDLSITSVAAGLPGPPLTRHYASAPSLQQDVIDARVWSGIHFRTADEIGCAMGTQVASWALGRNFAPES